MFLGTFVNVAAIIAGTTLGMLIGSRFGKNYQEITIKAMGLGVIVIGLQLAFKMQNPLITLGATALGAILGEAINVEGLLEKLGQFIKKKIGSNESRFVNGFVTAALLYCVGSMAILGAIEDGVRHDPSILYAKAILDGVISIAFGASMGVGVLFAAVPVLIYQWSISYLASCMGNIFNESLIVDMSSTGGILILGIGLNLLGITHLKMGNFLPAIFVAILLSIVF